MFNFMTSRGELMRISFHHVTKKVNLTREDGNIIGERRVTYCKLSRASDKLLLMSAQAICNPCDNFSYSRGRLLSLSRLLEVSMYARDMRKSIWENYWNKLNEPLEKEEQKLTNNIRETLSKIYNESKHI